jgi:hypothetical protein
VLAFECRNEEIREMSVSVAGVPGKIRTEHKSRMLPLHGTFLYASQFQPLLSSGMLALQCGRSVPVLHFYL